MVPNFTHLGIYSDIVNEAQKQSTLYPLAEPGPATQERVRQVLGFNNPPEMPQEVRTEFTWQKDGIIGEEISWSVGYGPRTHAWLLKPAGTKQPLPGFLALHDHGGFKYNGKEKIARGRDDPEPYLINYQKAYYGDRAWANALARQGFTVLVPDVFLWGSRRFPLETMLPTVRDMVIREAKSAKPEYNEPEGVALFNLAAEMHEHLVEKYCNLLGTTLAGVVSHEDRIAFNYLLSRPDVIPEQCGCGGLSGGGNRAALLQATHNQVAAAVIVGLMCDYAHLLDKHVTWHTWMLFPQGWARYGDWPDLAACRAPSPLLVQYDLDDELFPVEGMQAAHSRLLAHYQKTGHGEAYTGQFYPGPHKFDLTMQHAAFDWINQILA